jgi:hypothetical protein
MLVSRIFQQEKVTYLGAAERPKALEHAEMNASRGTLGLPVRLKIRGQRATEARRHGSADSVLWDDGPGRTSGSVGAVGSF